MKTLFFGLSSYVMLFFSFLYGQENSTILSISPEQIKSGDKISIVYDASAKGALLGSAGEITALCLIYRGEEDPVVMETPMSKEGNSWKATFTLNEPNARHLAFQFVSGETYDDNNRDCWTRLVYGNDGKPVQGAHASLAEVFQNGGSYFGENKNPEMAKEEVKKELELYPNNPDALLLYVHQHAEEQKTPETTERLRTTLGTLSELFKGNEKKLYRLSFLYAMIGDGAKGKELEETIITQNPKGYFAQQRAIRPYYSEKNTDKAAEILSSALENFPAIEEKVKQSMTENLAYRYTNEKQYEKAEQWLLKSPKPSSVYYNYLARTMVDDGINLEKAAELANKAVALNRQINPNDKKSYMRQIEWEDGNKNKLGSSLGTYGYALLKMENFADAQPALKEAYETNGGSSPDINQRYVLALIKNNNYDLAIQTGLQCIKALQDNAKMLEDLKDAYTARDGSDKNYSEVVGAKKQAFEGAITKAAKEHAEEIDKKIKEGRTAKPAMDFTLNDIAGKPVTLSELKGKVVIVDFWATWCGPCKQSFPYLQYIYEQYQSNENVKILAVNTWERIKGVDAILENTKKFMATNKYSFPVLMDDNEVVARYEVEGIPTKFIIDKKGNIAYTSIGFDGPHMAEEMRQQIDMLLKE